MGDVAAAGYGLLQRRVYLGHQLFRQESDCYDAYTSGSCDICNLYQKDRHKNSTLAHKFIMIEYLSNLQISPTLKRGTLLLRR